MFADMELIGIHRVVIGERGLKETQSRIQRQTHFEPARHRKAEIVSILKGSCASAIAAFLLLSASAAFAGAPYEYPQCRGCAFPSVSDSRPPGQFCYRKSSEPPIG